MKKILFIVNLDKFFVSHRLPIAISLIELGHEVHIATKFTDQESLLKNLGLQTHDLPIKRASLSLFSNFLTLLKIFKLINLIKPNLIHLITIKPILFGGLCSYYFKKIPIVASVSGLGFVFSDNGKFSKYRKKIITLLYKLALNNKNNVVIFQNKDDRNTLLKLTNLKKKNTRLIFGSGVDLNKYSVKRRESQPPIVLFAGRLLISKGILDFISASKLLKNIRFVIAGSFDEENPDCIKPSFINKMTSAGFIEYWGYNKNMVETIRLSSIVVLPSYYGEGLPKILIEAAACGKPVITTDHPGCRDAIINNVSGILIPIKSPIAIANAIKKIISSESLRKSMGKEGRILAEKKFSIKEVVSKHIDIYRELI